MTTTTEIKPCCAPSAHLVRNMVTAILGIKTPLDARKELRLSQAEIGNRLSEAHPNGRGGKRFERSTVSHWERGHYKLTKETQSAYLAILKEWFEQRSVGRLSIRIHFGRSWRSMPVAVCPCGREFIFKRVTDRYCEKCRRKRA